jgi:hypothetical protein
MKIYVGVDPRFLDLGNIWKLADSFTPLGKSPRYLLDRRLFGPQSQSGRYGEVLDLAGT